MVYVGEIVNTHGIKGELRIVSDFKYKESVFVSFIIKSATALLTHKNGKCVLL